MNNTNQSAFSRLSPFIREYIYKNRWDELRPIQEEACKVIFDTDDHLILASGTASGKTEAAFLPVLTLIEADPPSSVGVLYIAPMKALINDQFYRLTDLLEQSGIPLCHWHGDVPQSKKTKFLKNPGGVLQITPESLEAMLITRVQDLVRIFGDLRFVIIDEMHAFMSSERGLQVLCQLARLQKYMHSNPRRIGLSATLGDWELPAAWLSAGTERSVSIPKTGAIAQKIRLSVENFNKEFAEEDPNLYDHPAVSYMYERTLGKKAIVFGNGRPTPDAAIAAIRHQAKLNDTPDIYHVHHGAISSTLRETAEQDMKKSEGSVVIGATVTMELGVDIGRLERVFQIGSPISVSSFVQRLGRTGRRGEAPEMWFVECEREPAEDSPPLQMIPWYLLKTIAIIQLYIEERWIEPPKILKYSMSMLYHQIMSLTTSAGEISLPALVESLNSLPAFYNVEKEDIAYFIYELLKANHLQQMDRGGLIIGLEGEKIVNHYEFYGVFPSEEEWIVMHDSQKIGHMEEPHYEGEQITVAGYSWLVVGCDTKRLTIFVKPLPEKLRYWWPGDRALTHDRILQRMRQVLLEDNEYPYLGPNAQKRLCEGREAAVKLGFDRYNAIDLENGLVGIFPWMGHRNFRTLKNIMTHYMKSEGTAKRMGGWGTFYMTLNGGAGEILAELQKVIGGEINPDEFYYEETIRAEKKNYEYKVPKYDRYVPDVLLKKQVIEDYVDIPLIKEQVSGWAASPPREF
ncbi:MAG: DEAD/DEAH box helicase [Oscillospiraceae bacterium]|nr:DEAD/DEAH box helicase [Oscillospiraceae bacterium]